MTECCLDCLYLGECKDATLDKLIKEEGCGSFRPAPDHIVNARVAARVVAGGRALQQMLKKDPPKSKAKKVNRRKHA